jgi:hypothetical protein
VLALQSSRVDCAEFYASEADRFPGHYDPAFSQEIFDIPVAEENSRKINADKFIGGTDSPAGSARSNMRFRAKAASIDLSHST